MGLFDPLKHAVARALAPAVRTTDSIQNAAARLGLGGDNMSSYSQYAVSTVSRNRQNLDNAYRGSWLVGAAVDSVADDMARAGIEINGLEPKDVEDITAEWHDLALWQAIGNTVRWARLYGGCIAVMLIDGQDLSTPLRIETIRKGQFKGLLVLDRWMCWPSMEDLVTDFGPDMGLPRFYRINVTPGVGASAFNYGLNTGAPGNTGFSGVRIHYSRCIRFDGATLPFFTRQTENGWGQSVVERLYDRLLAYDSATQGAAQLVYRAHLRTLSVEGLREAIAYGGKAMDGLVAQVDLIRKFQSSEGLTLLDKSDEFATHAYTFAGLPELLNQFSLQLSGALAIPLVRLFGQSPSGFSTGDTDLAHYQDRIAAEQETKLRRPIKLLVEVVHRSRLGRQIDPSWSFGFIPLKQMSSDEKATIAGKITVAVTAAESAGIISQKVAMQELKVSSHATGVFGNISDKDINSAEADAPDPTEMAQPDGGNSAANSPKK
ncbi:MAG: DUF1073 domain-containing protein [Bradyrhizobium sp.]